MNFLVGMKVLFEFITMEMCDHFIVKIADVGNLSVTDVSAGGFTGQSFQGAHDVIGVLDVIQGQPGYTGTAIRQHFNQTFGLQNFQRFAEGRSGNAKLFTELFFGNFLSGSQCAVFN